MKTKKKVVAMALILVIIMSILSLSGCTSQAPSKAPSSSTPSPSSNAPAVNYPTKPVQVIVGYGAGGDADINARIMSKYMEKYLGKPFVVTNVTGAGGSVGARQAKNATPDGYTVLFSHWGTLMNTLMGIIDFSIFDGYELVGIPIVDKTSLFVGSSKGKYKTMKELMDDAKANPGKVKFSIEVGSVVHLNSGVLQDKNGVKFHEIDGGDNANRLASLKSNQTDVCIFQYASVKDYLKSGDFIALGALNSGRNPNYPDYPTLKEQGVQGLDAFEQKFFFFAFPKGTPKEIIKTFADAMQKVTNDSDAKKEFANIYVDLVYMDAQQSKDLITKVKDAFEPFISIVKK